MKAYQQSCIILESAEGSIASAFCLQEPLHTPSQKDVGPSDCAQQEPLTRNKAIPFATVLGTPALAGLSIKQDHPSHNRPGIRHGIDYNLPEREAHPPTSRRSHSAHVDLLNPTSRWMSAHRVVWLPRPPESKARSGCMHAYARPSFLNRIQDTLLDAN